jgi:Fe-S-cluster containining protein
MSIETPVTAPRYSGDEPFSYVCQRCRRCCHDKLIQVNPYEVARLARHLGLTTTAFIKEHLEESVFLRRREDGACVFLGPGGCTVHRDRPLVCRLYPLGRHVGGSGEVTYSHIQPHPDTRGVYGKAGTVADYLAGQEVGAFVAAADRYLAVLQKLFDAWRQEPAESTAPMAQDPGRIPDLMDLDRAVAGYCSERGLAEPADLENRMALHLAAIAEWLGVP